MTDDKINKRQMNNELSKLCSFDDKGVQSADNILARLFRQILIDQNITPYRLAGLLRDWQKELGAAQLNKKSYSRRRSTHIRAIAQSRISWKMFNRGLRLFKIRRYYFHVIFRHPYLRRDEHVCISNTESLADLFSIIKRSCSIDADKFKLLLDKWYMRPEQQDELNSNKLRKPKGNLERGLTSESLTWNFFIRGLLLLGINKAVFELRIDWLNGAPTVHAVEMDIKNVSKE